MARERKPKAPAPTPARHPRAGTVEPGDHVYAQHPERGPIAMKVLACGRDGFTGECDDGRRHAVSYDRMLGHKSRVKLAMKVIDAGQEGAIVEDERGRRHYLAGDLAPAPPGTAAEASETPVQKDPLTDGLDRLAKALDSGAPVLMLKAGKIQNAPGLALRDVTDKRGHQTKRWVRSMKDQAQPRRPAAGDPRDAGQARPAIEHGDEITFRHGQVRGRGTVIASGRDGVTVRDAQGQTHQVRHDAIEEASGGGGDGGDTGRDPPADSLDSPDHRPSSIGAKPSDEFAASDFAQQHDAADKATVEAILKSFPPDTAEKMAAIDDRLRKVTETKSQHFRDGAYTPERQEVHRKIVGHFLSEDRIAAARPKDGEKPTFTILGGRGGSGKSWFNGKVYDPATSIVLDADEIKHMLPEYEGWNAFQVHEESGDIFDQLTQDAADLGLNIVHDATMKTASKAVAVVHGFKEKGYRVEAHYMHLPRTEAARRAIKRFLGPTGRYVPPSVILGNTGNEAAFDQVKNLADRWSFHDNQGDGGPQLIAEGGPNEDQTPAAGEARPSGTHPRKDGRDGRPAEQPEASRGNRATAASGTASGGGKGEIRKALGGLSPHEAGGRAPLVKALVRRLIFWRA